MPFILRRISYHIYYLGKITDMPITIIGAFFAGELRPFGSRALDNQILLLKLLQFLQQKTVFDPKV